MPPPAAAPDEAPSLPLQNLVQLLLDRGAEVGGKHNNGAAALHSEAPRGHRDVCEMLLNRGAEVGGRDGDASTQAQGRL